ncbi:MAG: hypothetical protein HYU88_12640 [Chloroflexi bacterium]|nr:hypothetical protein [Chloroflexota bacterium]MBI4505456.1 hypothetical protein [Chloroflexota bacterium]
MRRGVACLLVLALAVLACAPAVPAGMAGVRPLAQQPAPAAGREVVFTIAPGTGTAQARGDQARLLPEALDLRVGDTLVIENRDQTFHSFGWFLVSPGQRYARTFTEPGTVVLFDLGCTGSGVGNYTTVRVEQ